jgi:hypothetical protein
VVNQTNQRMYFLKLVSRSGFQTVAKLYRVSLGAPYCRREVSVDDTVAVDWVEMY